MRKVALQSLPITALALCVVNIIVLEHTRSDSLRSWNLIATISYGVIAIAMGIVAALALHPQDRFPLSLASIRRVAFAYFGVLVAEGLLVLRLEELLPRNYLAQNESIALTVIAMAATNYWFVLFLVGRRRALAFVAQDPLSS
jgi:hypothetical protein